MYFINYLINKDETIFTTIRKKKNLVKYLFFLKLFILYIDIFTFNKIK